MAVSDDFRVDMWSQVLGLCRLDAAERVVVLTGENSNLLNLDAAMRSLGRAGVRAIRMDVPPIPRSGPMGADRTTQAGVTPLSGHGLGVDVLKSADLVIDLMGLLHSQEQLDILATGTRMLMVVEPPEVLAQMMPVQGDKQRVMTADALLRKGGTLHVTSRAGTDLTLALGRYPTLPEYGFADEPGHWDHWPSGFVSTWANDATAEGRVVIDAGDMMFPFKMYVGSPITLEIEKGYIRSIEGGFDAKYLRKYIEAYRDPEAYAVSHVGWGLQPKARWTGLGMRDKSQSLGMDARAFYGNFLFSTGPNSEAGGPNRSLCHIDIPMSDCSVSLNGEPMVVDGDVVAAGQRVSV